MTAPATETWRAGKSYRYIRRSFTPKGMPRNPLPYFTSGETITSGSAEPGNGSQALGVISATWDEYRAKAYAKAYDKFVSEAKNELSSQMAVNLAERNEAAAMLTKRVGQILKSVRVIAQWARGGCKGQKPSGLRKRKKPLAAPAGETSRDVSKWNQVKKGAKALSDIWLEYHFGWDPLFQDIYSAVQILQQSGGLPERSIITRGTSTYVYVEKYAPPGYYPLYRDDRCDYFVTLRGKVRVTNPNLFMANQLGVINPASTALELVPFSFVLEWFLPLGRFLESYSDQVGWTATELQVATTARCSYSLVLGGPYGHTSTAEGFQVDRQVGVPLTIPHLFDRSGNGIKSIVRGATAVALLVGFLKTH